MNKGQYELAKERKQQEYYALDIKQLEHKNAAKRHAVDAEKIKIDIAREGINAARISLDQSRTSNDISKEKLTQSRDTLAYEKGMTRINQQQILTQANQAMLNLSAAQTELEEGRKLHQLKFNKQAQRVNMNRSFGG